MLLMDWWLGDMEGLEMGLHRVGGGWGWADFLAMIWGRWDGKLGFGYRDLGVRLRGLEIGWGSFVGMD